MTCDGTSQAAFQEYGGNLVGRIWQRSQHQADTIALRLPSRDGRDQTSYDTLSYGDLWRDVTSYQAGFQHEGWTAGDRVIVLTKPSRELYGLLLALLASGLVPVFIDTGMGRKKMLQAIVDAHAKALITTKAVLQRRLLLPPLWRLRGYAVDGHGLGVRALQRLRGRSQDEPGLFPCTSSTPGLISFTSGSTGRPKGADRTHNSLLQQCCALDAAWTPQADAVALTSLPVATLYGLSCGMTVMLADCDLAAPGAVEPERIVTQLQTFQVTQLNGAPAFISRIADDVWERDIKLPHLQTVFVGGAPSSPALCRRYHQGFPDADVVIIYGSTEAEPMSTVHVQEVLTSPGSGVLVGQPVSMATLALCALPDTPRVDEAELMQYRVQDGDIGEILVKGPHVLKGYVDNPEATLENKIPCADGEVWHRTGDTGYMDDQQRLWLTGRLKDVVSHQGQRLQPYPLECVIDDLAGVRRSALIQGPDTAAALLVLEALPGADPAAITAAVQDTLAAQALSGIDLAFVERLPMDGRHNSKVDRLALRDQYGR